MNRLFAICLLPVAFCAVVRGDTRPPVVPSLVFDGVLGRSGIVGEVLPSLPTGIEWKAPAEARKSDYTNLVGCAVSCVGRLGETGELLVGTSYPNQRLRLFAEDGTEVQDGLWPLSGWFDHIAQAGGRTWGLKRGAVELTRRRRGSKSLRVGGREAQECRGIVCVDDGWWLLSRQGWLFYGSADPQRCVRRHGDLKNVTALALLDGMVYVFSHSRLDTLWLDDRPDEALQPFGFDNGRAAGRWSGTVDAAEVVGGKIRYSFSKEGKNFMLDPAVKDWVKRALREYSTDAPVSKKPGEAALLGGWKAEADGSAIVLRSPKGNPVQTIPVAATILASEGRWLVAYVPAENAIFRYWFEEGKR